MHRLEEMKERIIAEICCYEKCEQWSAGHLKDIHALYEILDHHVDIEKDEHMIAQYESKKPLSHHGDEGMGRPTITRA